MFDCLLKQYETDVFNTEAESNIWEVLKSYKRVRIMVLVCMIVVGMILSVVRQKNGCGCLSLCAFLVTLFCIFLLFNQMKSEEPIILEAINKPTTKTRMENMIKLLQKFNINVINERKLNQLIGRAERAEKEQDQKKLWSLLQSAIFMILPVLLSQIFKEAGWQTSINIAIWLIFIFAMVLFFGECLRDLFFSSEKQILDSFISDVEDIKLFQNKICSIIKCEPDGPCVPEYAIKAEKERAGTVGGPQAAGHKKPPRSAEQK